MFAHAQDRLEHLHHIVLKESKRIPGLCPGCAVDFLEFLAKFLRFALTVNEAFQLGNFQVVSIKPAVVVEHLSKGAANGSLIFIDGALNVDVEQDGLCGDRDAFDRLGVHHRIVKLVLKVIEGRGSADHLIGEQIGEHF